MKVVGISGSPRKGGNTEYLVKECLNEFARQGWAVSEFFLSEIRGKIKRRKMITYKQVDRTCNFAITHIKKTDGHPFCLCRR